MTNTPRWFDAQFTDGTTTYTVGPFDTLDEAHTWGQQHATAELRYTGTAARVGRQELAQVAAQLHLKDTGQQDKRHTGVITRWDDGSTHGFITDPSGTSWFASRDSLPDSRTTLPLDTRVTFTGSPKPAPGKKYPQAFSIRTDVLSDTDLVRDLIEGLSDARAGRVFSADDIAADLAAKGDAGET